MARDGITTENRVRLLLYHYDVISEDIESQRKGLVLIVQLDRVMVEHFLEATAQERKDVVGALNNIPIRLSAQHYCMPEDSPLAIQMLKGMWGFIQHAKDERFRLQLHAGIGMEVGSVVFVDAVGKLSAHICCSYRQCIN